MPRAKRNEEPIPFSLPASLVSSIDSSPSTQRWLWIVGTLSNHITTQKEDEVDYNPHSYKPLDSRILIDILSTSYPKHIEKLKKEKIIEVELSEDGEESYDSVTGKAKRYRLCEKYPEVYAQWHPTKNGELTALEVYSYENFSITYDD